MSNVIEFMQKKWCAGSVKCFHCMHEWVGVWPENISLLYCPKCDGPYGLPLDAQEPSKPARKPMTDFREYFEEMHSQLQEDYGDNVHIFEAGFKEGARWVQLDHSVFKHHGIGGDNE